MDKLQKLFIMAERGDHLAQNNLGWAYYIGEGVPQDFKTAFYWTKKAGDAGNVYAFETLAMMYWNGEGTEPDFNEALYWLAKGGDAGNPGMQKVLRQIKAAAIMETEGKILLEEAPNSWYFGGEKIIEMCQCVWTAWPTYRQEEKVTLQELIEEMYGESLEISGGKGTSIEDAIVVDTKFDGVGLEYEVIKYLFNGQGKVVRQYLMGKDGKHYDKLQVQVGNDRERIHSVYFNIDKFCNI